MDINDLDQHSRPAHEAPAQRERWALTPLQIINPQASDLDDPDWKVEMTQAWESDWSEL